MLLLHQATDDVTVQAVGNNNIALPENAAPPS